MQGATDEAVAQHRDSGPKHSEEGIPAEEHAGRGRGVRAKHCDMGSPRKGSLPGSQSRSRVRPAHMTRGRHPAKQVSERR